MSQNIRRMLSTVSCLVLILSPLAVPVNAQARVTITIGKPNIWSLAQAHYLLANLRQADRSLKTKAITELDPNSINGARVDILRTLIGAEVQVSTPQALQNRIAEQQFAADFSRKQSAIARLDELSKEQLQVIKDISDLDIELAKLGPQPAADKQDEATERKRESLTQQKAAKVNLRDAIAGQITTVSTQASAAATISGLQTAMPLGTPAAAPTPREDLGDIKSLVHEMVGNNSIPSIDASQQLESHIAMQYEIIARQLTLLRDEVGPDERLVFLELPSSIFSVPKVDDGQLVQIKWNVSEYLELCDNPQDVNAAVLKQQISDAEEFVEQLSRPRETNRINKQAPPITDDSIDRFFKLMRNPVNQNYIVPAIYSDAAPDLKMAAFQMQQRKIELQRRLERDKRNDKLNSSGVRDAGAELTQPQRSALAATQEIDRRLAQIDEKLNVARSFDALMSDQKRTVGELKDMLVADPHMLRLAWRRTNKTVSVDPAHNIRCQDDEKAEARVVDIIPRQSALNVNDANASEKGLALTAKFLALFGFGAEVSYQRQRSVYEQFINQDVFASGFGKGTGNFGWTMGPKPGSKQLSPGPRTTFAILVIPHDAWKISLQASAVAFPRDKSPTDARDAKSWTQLTTPGEYSFDLLVPNESSEGFWVDKINYTPARKGEFVTAMVSGQYFSPLTGVLVNGLPLTRVVAIAKHENDPSAAVTTAPDSPGEYEYLNSNQIVMNFKAGADFIGTPLITLVTPEKTATINYFRDLTINGKKEKDSLQNHSLIEPMFEDDLLLTRLDLDRNDFDAQDGDPIRPRLIGSGFRRGAEICLQTADGIDCQVKASLKSTGEYDLTFDKPTERNWTIIYHLNQKTAAITFDSEAERDRTSAPTIDSIENPDNNRPEGPIAGGYVVTIRGKNLQTVQTVFFGEKRIPVSPENANVLLVKVPAGDEGAVQILLRGKTLATVDHPSREVSNITDFVTPGKAIFKYVKPPKPENKEDEAPPKKPKKPTRNR